VVSVNTEYRNTVMWTGYRFVEQLTTMYEFANCTSTPVNDRDAQDHQTSAMTMELAVDASLHHHQTAVVNSTTAQSGVHGRAGMDLTVTGHHDHYSLTSSKSAAAAAAVSLSRHQHQGDGNSGGSTTLREELEYVNDLRAREPFAGAMHTLQYKFLDPETGLQTRYERCSSCRSFRCYQIFDSLRI